MQTAHPYTRRLVIVLLLLALTPGTSTQAEEPPPDPSAPAVSLARPEREMLLPAYTGCGGVPGVPSSNEAIEQDVVRLVNEERASRGLPPLKRVSLLDEAARYFATDMGQDDYWPAPPAYVSHGTYDRDDGSLVYVCDWSARILSYYQPDWAWLAENIGAGYTTAEGAMYGVNGWMNSEGHRGNILSTDAREIGVGYYEGSGTYTRYWVQDFGRRRDIYPLIINRDAVETDSRDVSLYIYGSEEWTEMRLRNDDNPWTAWQPFQPSLDWTLGCGEGEHTVWAETRAGAQTTVSSDTVRLTAGSTLGNLPSSLQFTYSIPEQQLLPTAHQATPLDVESGCPLTWTIAAEGSWFAAAPVSGTTPASFWITPTTFVTNTVVTYTGAVTVTVTDPGGVEGSPHRAGLTLQVVDEPFSYVYLPLVMRDYTPPLPPPLPPRYPNDPYYNAYQWGPQKANAPAAWAYTTGQTILVAVLDSGADLDHPDLAGKLRTDLDWDFVNGDDEADDDHTGSHGTHVSGIAAAATDNGVGVAGMGWDATILPLKVLDDKGDGNSTVLAQAIISATDKGADVINMSLGGEVNPCPAEVQSAANYAYGKGVVLVAAAGNNLGNTEMFPANCEHVLGVAATDSDDTWASYSNYGDHVSVAAPGSFIYSTMRDGSYGYKHGTSMATPHVAGLAALVFARYPSYTPDQVASAILDNSVDLGATGWDQYYGCGRIDAFAAVYTGTHGSSPVCLGTQPWAADRRDTAPTAPFVPGEIVVAFRPGIQAEQVTRQYALSAEFLPVLNIWRLQVPPGQEQAILAQLRSDPSVAYAELNYLVFAQ